MLFSSCRTLVEIYPEFNVTHLAVALITPQEFFSHPIQGRRDTVMAWECHCGTTTYAQYEPELSAPPLLAALMFDTLVQGEQRCQKTNVAVAP